MDGRGGYFDKYGVVRDVMQNHLTQILALVAMEQPLSLSAKHILQEKLKVLSSVQPLERKDLVIGQYAGYLDEPSIDNKQSCTETFAAAVLHINNPRWAGVPFVLKAGKALNENRAEVRIKFQQVPGIIAELAACQENELIIRIQPGEGIYWKIQNKVPGLHFQVAPMRMDLMYQVLWRRAGQQSPRKLTRARAARPSTPTTSSPMRTSDSSCTSCTWTSPILCTPRSSSSPGASTHPCSTSLSSPARRRTPTRGVPEVRSQPMSSPGATACASLAASAQTRAAATRSSTTSTAGRHPCARAPTSPAYTCLARSCRRYSRCRCP